VKTDNVDLSVPRRIHVVGVGGAGMSAIASVLSVMGHEVTGSDLKPSVGLDRLRSTGIGVFIGHDAQNVDGAELLTVSSAVPASNPEVLEARRRGIPVVDRAAALAAITRQRRTVAVAGTHGKTTTTSMLALILVEAGIRPSFLIGGDVNEIGTNAVWDTGEWLVVEADESDGTFLELATDLAVVTNVEADHLDHYGSLEALQEAFEQFCVQAPGGVVAGADDETAARIGARHSADLVGVSSRATTRIVDLVQGRTHSSFSLRRGDTLLGRIELAVPGTHNVRNAAVATAAALRVGVPFSAASNALARFAGVARRFEFRGEANGVRFVDDYAHLPTEVAAALQAAGTGGWDRVVAVFQPHRYSRTAALGDAFGEAFGQADVVVVTDVYGAGEPPLPGVSGRVVADAVRRAHPEVMVSYVPTRERLRQEVAAVLRPGDLCLTLGAGDLTSLPDELLAEPSW
jgi:UDP-N-acetylmuramate--alanine ligase